MSHEPFAPGPGWAPYSPGRRVYPELSVVHRRELDLVPPSRDDKFAYKPCEVTLANGTVLDRVYVQDAASYIHLWGVWPEDDSGKSSVDISQVVQIRGSGTRLPPQFAEELYRAGELSI